jgi:type I restriction enzyme M protein
VLADFAARNGVTRRKGKVVKSIPQEVAFVNRCLEFLAPGGRLGIVLPDGVLANTSMQYIRDWILRWARLKAVVSLPQETFAPYGAGVKTSVIFLEKREKPLIAEGQLELGQEITEADQDYEVYMARIDDIGYDATGRLSVTEEEAPFPPEVSETVAEFERLIGWQ